MRRFHPFAITMLTSVMLAACGGGEGTDETQSNADSRGAGGLAFDPAVHESVSVEDIEKFHLNDAIERSKRQDNGRARALAGAPPITYLQIWTVQSSSGGSESIADAQTTTVNNHGGASMAAYTMELGYGGNRIAKMNGSVPASSKSHVSSSVLGLVRHPAILHRGTDHRRLVLPNHPQRLLDRPFLVHRHVAQLTVEHDVGQPWHPMSTYEMQIPPPFASTAYSAGLSSKSVAQPRPSPANATAASSMQEMSSKYNVRSMSGPEIRAMTDDLIASGKLAPEESTSLVLMGELKQRQGLDEVRTNLLDAVHGAYDFAKGGSGRGDPKVLEKALALLQSMDRVRQGQPENYWRA